MVEFYGTLEGGLFKLLIVLFLFLGFERANQTRGIIEMLSNNTDERHLYSLSFQTVALFPEIIRIMT